MKAHFFQAFVVCMVLPVLAAGCRTNPVTGKREFLMISPEEEMALGTQAAPGFAKEFGGRVTDRAVQDYVQQIGQRLAVVSDRELPYEYALLRSDVPNAFALPGGKIFITAGLMSMRSSPAIRPLAATNVCSTPCATRRSSTSSIYTPR